MVKIGPRIVNNITFLHTIAKANKSDTRRLLKKATSDQLLAIIEIAYNLLRGKLRLNSRQKQILRPLANVIRHISQLRNEQEARRLIQTGGAIVPAIVAIVSTLLAEAVRSLASENGS